MPRLARRQGASRRAPGGQGHRGARQARQRGGAVAAQAYIAVVGPGRATAEQDALAEQVGRGLAVAGAILICGGLGGVMAAACRGATGAGGIAIGLLPGADRRAANEHVTIAIATGLGELRNGLIVRAADAVIAIGGAYGTLSEIALALKASVPVVGLHSWDFEGIEAADSSRDAVSRALRRARPRPA